MQPFVDHYAFGSILTVVRKALFWSISSQLTSIFINFAGSVVIAHLLSPHEMGVFAVAIATIGVLQIFTSFGIGLYVVRELELTPQTVASAFTMNALLSLLLGMVMFGLSFVGTRFLSEPAVGSVLRLLAVTPVISALSFTPGVMLQRAMLFQATSIIAIAAAIITAGVTVATALAGAHYLSPAFGSVCGTAFSTAATIAVARHHFSLRLSSHGWRRMFVFGMRILSINGISSASARLCEIIVGRMLGLSALGLYSRATSINNLIFQNAYGSMTRVVFSRLSEAQRQNGDVSHVYLRSLRVVSAVMGPGLLGLAVIAKPVVRIVYGERWIGAALPLSLLLIGQFISLSFAMNWELFVVRDKLEAQTKLEITRSIVSIVTQVIGGFFSLEVVAATGVFDQLIALLLYNRYMPVLANTTHGRLMRIYMETFILTAIGILPALVFMAGTRWQADVGPLALAVVICLGAILWLAAVFRSGHPIADELRNVFAFVWAKFSRPRNAVSLER